ncbi:TIGR01620 family protein [Pseudoalteromonas sp. Of7M-16]|uniref:TIGR01620 family protein n=1 Tax=Pseudoalteromonas sp. Of7M-16 TaxID=2917756 RepID=UPI001EF5E6AE|nr:YcjF family protein [Pseudoalteromonas sp. Of7M-16]
MTNSKHRYSGRRIETEEPNHSAHEATRSTPRFGERIDDEVSQIDSEQEFKPFSVDGSVDSSLQPQKSKLGWRHGLLASLVILIPVELVFTIYDAFQQSIILASLYLLLFVSALGWGTKFLFREVKALRTLKNLEARRDQAERLLNSNQIGEAQHWLSPLLANLPADTVSSFQKSLKSHYTDQEVLQLYEVTLLRDQDMQAKKIIAEYATTSALMVALSPMAVTDMLAVLWRGVSLVEKLSAHYGITLGYRSRIKLYKLLATQIVFVGASELLSDLAATSLGAELLGKLSARSAQGLSAGVFTARLGYKAMALCRPIPRMENKANFLADFAKKLTNQLIKQN